MQGFKAYLLNYKIYDACVCVRTAPMVVGVRACVFAFVACFMAAVGTAIAAVWYASSG